MNLNAGQKVPQGKYDFDRLFDIKHLQAKTEIQFTNVALREIRRRKYLYFKDILNNYNYFKYP